MATFSKRLLAWFDKEGRHDLPWQNNPTPYRVWVSEVMLQQTQVVTVIPYYQKFMRRFPDVLALSNASDDDVLALWSGLGYYSRARNLHKAAKLIRDEHGGEFPQSFDEVVALPGIGRSTAGAILAIACQQHYAILDGNVKRVLSRFHAVEGWPGKRDVEQYLWTHAEKHTPKKRIADYTQAIMDLGATLCTRSKPHCDVCPMRKECVALAQDRVSDFPGKKSRKTLPTKHVVMPVVFNQAGEVLLEKRPPTGIWGGLWSLPECEDESALMEWCETYFDEFEIDINPHELKHTFSHYHLRIKAIGIEPHSNKMSIAENDLAQWRAISELEVIGLPTPVRRVLKNWEC